MLFYVGLGATVVVAVFVTWIARNAIKKALDEAKEKKAQQQQQQQHQQTLVDEESSADK